VKTLVRGFGLVLLMGSLWGLTGCGADNESEATKAQQSVGAPPPTDVKGAEAGPPSRTMEDYAKQRPDPYAGTKYGSGKKK
jgi:hypothetical protein